MLVRVFRVVRPEQVSELRAGVLDEVTDGLQAGEDNQIPHVKYFPEAPAEPSGSMKTVMAASPSDPWTFLAYTVGGVRLLEREPGRGHDPP